MNIDLSAITSNAIVVVPIVIALVQAIKLTGWVQDHFSPLLAIAIGILISFLSNHNTQDLSATALYGAVYGLMSSGLYSGVKTTMVAHARMKEKRQREKHHNQNKHDNH